MKVDTHVNNVIKLLKPKKAMEIHQKIHVNK